jgi:hypothetical protein
VGSVDLVARTVDMVASVKDLFYTDDGPIYTLPFEIADCRFQPVLGLAQKQR